MSVTLTAPATPATIAIRELSTLSGISVPTLERMKRDGLLPLHFHPLGSRMVKWSRAEMLAWIAAGMPPRAEWEATKKARR